MQPQKEEEPEEEIIDTRVRPERPMMKHAKKRKPKNRNKLSVIDEEEASDLSQS